MCGGVRQVADRGWCTSACYLLTACGPHHGWYGAAVWSAKVDSTVGQKERWRRERWRSGPGRDPHHEIEVVEDGRSKSFSSPVSRAASSPVSRAALNPSAVPRQHLAGAWEPGSCSIQSHRNLRLGL